jgi:serine/threonine protein phosphatase PrpC
MELTDKKELLHILLKDNHLPVAHGPNQYLDTFLENPENNQMVMEIVQKANLLMEKWRVEERKRSVMEKSLRIPNGTVGRSYEAPFDAISSDLTEIAEFHWKGLEDIGLHYDGNDRKIKGVPTKSGDFPLTFGFRVQGENESADFGVKPVIITINPDPKTLWKNIPTDTNDPYWKPDGVTVFSSLHERSILVSSKRGRSHAHTGAFREDHFAFAELKNGWSIVALADGAGSAKLSRKGSQLACDFVVKFFEEDELQTNLSAFDALIQARDTSTDKLKKQVNLMVYNVLGQAALGAHKNLEAFSSSVQATIKDLSTTLIFVLLKKYTNGYAIMSFGVGDCPMALISEDLAEVTLLNWIDVGEFGGGTRFITMSEIFQSDKFATRFSFRFVKDFAFLFMMSDGIYDAKFVVESALKDVEKWKALLDDLQGKNEEELAVEFRKDNSEIEQQFSKWMDFWSPGNHDDRTLAIIY